MILNLEKALNNRKYMENLYVNSLKTINQNISTYSIKSIDQKFKKISPSQQQIHHKLNQFIVYQAAIQQCNRLNQQLIEFKELENNVNHSTNKQKFKTNEIQEPKKAEIKVLANIQRSHSSSMHRSKSSHQNLKNSKRNFSAGRNKVYTTTRFSSKLIQSKLQIQPHSPLKEFSSLHKKTLSTGVKEFQQDKNGKKTVQKRVRLKTNSVVSLSGDLLQQVKYTQCIPLEGYHNREDDSFWQNAYRLRKGQVPVWHQVSKTWDKTANYRKLNQANGKQHKKIIFQGYDFNGELIPSANMGSKSKKISDDLTDIYVQFANQNGVQNLQNYHQRQQRYARTVKKIKIKQPEYIVEQSEFLNKLDNLEWNKNIQYIRKAQTSQQQQNQQQNKQNKQIKIQQKRQRNTSLHQNSLNHKNNKSQKIQQQQNKKIDEQKLKNDHQQLLQEFQKIKFCKTQNQLNQNHNFHFGFSKYVKVKKFQQKQKKSKSHNYHTVNFFTTPQQFTQINIQSNLKIKSPQPKGYEKVRANKRLFKQVFNMSLKFIQPDNRQDIVTIKLIKDKQKQNAQDSQKQRKIQLMRKHCPRNSDTLLLKKGFCIKPTIFKQMEAIKRPKSSKNMYQQSSRSKNQSQKLSNSEIKESNKQNSHQETSQRRYSQLQNSITSASTKGITQNYRKTIDIGRNSVNSQNLQKLFKKQTKKTLIKHSGQDNRRQSFL